MKTTAETKTITVNDMLKRILSLLMVLVMCASLVPACAFADDGEEPAEIMVEELPPEDESVPEEPAAEDTLPEETSEEALPHEEIAEEAEHVHEYVLVEEVPATEEADGVKEHYICSSCGGLFVLIEEEYVEVTKEELSIPVLTAEEENLDGEPDLEASLEEGVIARGECGAEGDNLTWVLTGDGTLTISGEGGMYDGFTKMYSNHIATSFPWGKYYDEIIKVILESGVTSIGEYAFYSCRKLTSVEIPDSVTSIGRSAFDYCRALEKIEVDSGNTCYWSEGNCIVTKSTNTLLVGCKTTIIPESVTSIADNAFYECRDLTSIKIPDGVTSIGNCAFWCCRALSDINLPDGITHIGKMAFLSCHGLTDINIPDGLTSIEEGVFEGCSGLTEIELPLGLTSIEDTAFEQCSGLKAVTIPDGVTKIAGNAFSDCANLENIDVDIGNEYYRSEGNCIIEISTNKVVVGCKASVIPDGVTAIGNHAFFCCKQMKSIDIPNSVTSINYYALGGCTGLTYIELPNSMTSIGSCGFYYCIGLKSIAIPNSVTTVESSAFSYCNSLKDVYYSGTEEEWASINVEKGNEPLLNARIHFKNAAVRFWVDGECVKQLACEDNLPVTGAPTRSDGSDYEWFTDPQFTDGTEWNLAADTVSGSLDLYALPGRYTVRFIAVESGTETCTLCELTDVRWGAAVNAPEECEGVSGWYRDATLTEGWSFEEDRIYEDTVIYAALEKEEPEESGISVEFVAGPDACFSYTGSAICPEVTVKYNGTVLEEGTDYKVNYRQNKKLCDANDDTVKDNQKPQAVIMLKGNYKSNEKLTLYFSIVPFSLADADVTYPETVQVRKNNRLQTVSVTVKNGGAVIPKKDYVVRYFNESMEETSGITGAGCYFISIQASPDSENVTGELLCETPVRAAAVTDISNLRNQFSLDRKESVYDGGVQKPVITAAGLTENRDYTVSYPENMSGAGTYKITVTGRGDYYGSFTLSWKIKALDLKAAYESGELTASCSRTAEYSASGARPDVTVEYKGIRLTEGIDYALRFGGNKKAGGRGSVRITGKGSFRGSAEGPKFTVESKPLDSSDISVSIKSLAKKNKKWNVKLSVIDGGKTIPAGHYNTAVTENGDCITLTVTAKGNSNYTGTRGLNLPKDQLDISDKKAVSISFAGKNTYSYTGKPITPQFEIRNAAGEDISSRVSVICSGNTDTGTATATVTGIPENGACGSRTLTFRIVSPLTF